MADSLPRNTELADTFQLLADLLQIDGADNFRLSAYRSASQRMRDSATGIAALALEGKAKKLDGIGKTIEAKIVELVETGDIAALAKLRDQIPVTLVDVMRLPGIGPKTARRLWEELGVETLEDLGAAARKGEVKALSGLGAKSEQRILDALERPKIDPDEQRILLGRALPLVEQLVAHLRTHPACERVSEAGSVRRRAETVKDVDLIATSDDAPALLEHYVAYPNAAEVTAHGETKATLISQDGISADLRVVQPACYGNLLQHFSGSAAHNVALRETAVREGFSVSEWGIETSAGETLTMESEEKVYEALGYAWIPPELRENTGELDAAREASLPRLVESLRGDLHMHTTWSDGRLSVEEMAQAAKARGLTYIAICDHSPRLRDGRLEAQAAEIAAVNERIPRMRVLSGVEVDIRGDGSLDMTDERLAELDWVVASIHSGFQDSGERLTARVLAAIENPLVDCIAHPTGRRLRSRPPYELDLDAVFAAAASTGTALEINGQPDRLDLRDAHARAAAAAGVTIVCNSDAHSLGALAYSDFALMQARRAWLTADDILNAAGWRDVQRWQKSRRG
ncbi:MAG: DNA polymerase/3'-5' exonuclease PolX [Gaiellaceae bacterium]